ncbi:molecular chaperone DnaJ [Microbulbifer magnicolonia]|uniref:molecular chaperone DnaJ n=1 Tax=Microbulbifer magnicolonia TaxID=3109744 RepID=UPI002B409A6B|nr:molecular chaperone DnaJ [Microbulbifer sp. GG15]
MILLIAVGIFAWLAWQKFKASAPQERRKLLLQWLLIGLALIAVLLAISGRLHWVGAAIALTLPVLGRTLSWLGRHLPWLAPLLAKHAQARQQQKAQENASDADKAPPLTPDEARRILGVGSAASREEIIGAHRKLIQKLHPDRGGNDYLASRINAAKELLLRNL